MKKYLALIIVLFTFNSLLSQTKFSHILITNDDGIEDSKRLIALAKSVSLVADRVTIIVSEFDRSGTSNYSTYGKYNSTFELTCQYNNDENNIEVYTTPGNPADCVLLGLGGGPNIGPNWFGSGTIGAARTAAYFGVKAIAFSGFDDDNEKSFTVLPEWITAFVSSGILAELQRGDYLTVGFPKIPLDEIKGIKLVERRVMFDYPEIFEMKRIYGEEPNIVDSKTIWTPEMKGNPFGQENKLDNDHLDEGYVVITPMSINENDHKTLENLKKKSELLPKIISNNHLK